MDTLDSNPELEMGMARGRRSVTPILIIGFLSIFAICWYTKSASLLLCSNSISPIPQAISAGTKEESMYVQREMPVNAFDFDGKSLKPNAWIEEICYQGKAPKVIDDISTVKKVKQSRNSHCRDLYISFESIYQIREKSADIIISDSFLPKVRGWLKDNEELIEKTKHQTLIFVDNLYTTESVVFNPVRARRPGGNGGSDKAIVDKLLAESIKTCDFCRYKKYTASDSFGVLESKHAAIISNTFKIEKFHGMILFRHHNPSEFTLEEFLDGMDLASKWYGKTISLAPDHKFRHMYWDVHSKASASQIHAHIHLTVANDHYYGKWDHMRRSALAYAAAHSGRNYWTNLIKAHHLLGLAVHFKTASALAYVTPQKDYGTFVISRDRNLDFFKMVYFVVRAFIDDLGLYSYSAGFVFPKLGADSEQNGNELPAIFYIVYRGSLESCRSDVSSFDLFGTPNVNKDPYKLIETLKTSVKKRQNEHYDLPKLKFS